MNRDIFRLVFNQERMAWIPVAEWARGRGKKAARRHLSKVALGLATAGALGGGLGNAHAGLTPPPANAVPVPSSGSRPFIFAGTVVGGAPVTTANANGGRDMTITTLARTLGLNWQKFDIGSASSVTFIQPDAASRVLNRIWDNDPSQIMGRLTATGQVYLINQNGILFGAGSQVNVGGLVASSLGMTEANIAKLLNNGLPTAKGDSLEFAWDGSAAGFNAGYVTVEAGARITTPTGGKVLLIAPRTVENLGLIESGGGGEAILAAGGKVILTAPEDPNLRGLLVETQSFKGRDDFGNAVTLDGSVTNKSDGEPNSDNGRINLGANGVVSLAALAVNQKGIVNATKAVNLNGTTILVSGDTDTNRLTINQRGSKAEIDWVSGFNVGAGKTVEFVQSSSGAVAYNYVHDADRTAADGSTLNQAGRSTIDGTLKANGQVVLINEKGIDFGTHADVSAANLIASGLGVNPTLVENGIFNQDGVTRAFYLRKALLSADDADARAAFDAATINVAAGAKIASNMENGFVMLLGSQVNQAGAITTPKGQALLAAGADIYLTPPFSGGLRGFMAETNPLFYISSDQNNPWVALAHGSINNTGTITAPLGNITLSAFDITQDGTLYSSTSATANGSIRLVARDQLNSGGNAIGGEPLVAQTNRNISDEGIKAYSENESVNTSDPTSYIPVAVGTVGGHLAFATGSITEIAIDGSSGKTVTADQNFLSSRIEALAAKIDILGATGDQAGARLSAKGGRIALVASDSFRTQAGFVDDSFAVTQGVTPPANVGVFVGDGAKLDVSGVTASKSVADLFVEVELRGDEFANNPVQRNGALRGEKAWVDIRDGVAIADVSGWVGKVGQTVEEKAAAGGTIGIKTSGSAIVKAGATLDVSGGRVDYAAGTVSESRAVTLGGQSYRLNDAPSAAAYAGLTTVRRTEAAYSEGKNAGAVSISGHSLAVDGTLKATTTPGAKQRNVGTGDRYALPLGGQLILRDAGPHYATASDRNVASEAEKIAAYTQAQVAFVHGAAHAADGLDATSSAGPRLELSDSLVGNGFSRFDIKSDGRIDLAAGIDLTLAPGGSFSLSGRQVYVGGSVTAAGGSISLTSRDMSTAAGAFPTLNDARYSTLVVDAGAKLSTAGRWVNDYLDGKNSTRAKATAGGSVSLESAYDLDIRAGSLIDVSGGAHVSTAGKLTAGKAGSLTLSTGGMKKGGGFNFTEDIDRRDASLFLDGTLAGYSLGQGGTLTINTSAVRLGERFSADSRAWSRADRLAAGQVGAAFDESFFNQGGFYSFKLAGRDGLTVLDDARIAPTPINWSLATVPSYRYQASGSAIAGFARSQVLHPDLRAAPTSLTLATRSLNFGTLRVGEGAYLGVSPKGSIDLQSWGQLTVLGTLEAPGGSISLSRPAGRSDEPYNKNSIIYSEAKQSESIFLGAQSQLLAQGATVLDAATRQALEGGASADALRASQRYKGKVLDGGRVSLDAGLGYLISEAGSSIDVSGASDSLNVATSTGSGLVAYPLTTVGSAGGTVSLTAREGMMLDGGYRAAGKNGALGGTFALNFSDRNSLDSWETQGLPDAMKTARQLNLFQSGGTLPAQWTTDTATYLAGTTLLGSAAHNGKASFDLSRLTGADLPAPAADIPSAGFGSWYLGATGEIRLAGTIDATVSNQLRLAAPKFSAANDATHVTLTAAALQLGNFVGAGAPDASASLGGAIANFNARDIGISGNFSWNGFGTTQFTSSGAIHFDGTANSAPNAGGGWNFGGQMTASGTLGFDAAYLAPSTYSNYRIDLSADAASRIDITRPAGASVADSLAVGGRLDFAAATIDHQGTITAPLGEVRFTSPSGSVTLGETSVTSVAGGRTLLLGETDQSGRYWKFAYSYWDPLDKQLKTNSINVEKAPEKAIRIDAADTEVKSGARLDVSAGGEAIAAEFTPGPGGKTDILKALEAASPATFAVLPGWNGAFAPMDAEALAYYNVSNPRVITDSNGNAITRFDGIPSLKAGDQVALTANGSGLAAGTYTLLPAKYALLPGAYLVTLKTTSDSVTAGAKVQADGAWLVSGARLAANADGSSSRYSQLPVSFEVANPAVTAARARYQITTASQYFYDTAGARLPGDVGQVSVAGRNSLAFDPVIVATRQAEIAAADGRQRAGEGLQLDLAAAKLLVSDGSAPSPGADWSVLDQAKLMAYGADSLLLGGLRSQDGGTTRIDTVATDLKVANSGATDVAKALTGPELLLTAKDDLTVAAGSRVESGGTAPSTDTLALDGDGAFLRVAESDQARLTREGTVNRSRGRLNLAAGAQLAGRSVIADATKETLLAAGIELGVRQTNGSRQGGALTLGAPRINVVGDGSTPADGLTLSNADLARFAQADALRLNSYTTLDLYGDAVLGTSSLKSLAIGAAGVAGHGAASAVATLAAQSLTLDNPNPASASFTTSNLGGGTLNVNADQITLGANVADQTARDGEQTGFAMRGIDTVKLTATGDLRLQGLGVTTVDNAGGSNNAAALTLDAGRVTTVGTADHLLAASGRLEIKGGGTGSSDLGLGGKLDLRGKSVAVSGRLETPSGTLKLTATGTGAVDGVSIEAGARLAAEGKKVAFGDTLAYGPGGTITLSAAKGDVTVASGAVASVSADADGGDAGTVKLVATEGAVSAAAGTLRARAKSGDATLSQGSLQVDARTVNLDNLADAVVDSESTRHFGGEWDIRARNGSLNLSRTIKATTVNVAADNGGITVDTAGTIDASGAKGGDIGLQARGGDVTLKGQLLARGTEVVTTTNNAGTRGQGGTVILSSRNGKVITESDSLIDVGVATDSQAQAGKVTFRAAKSAAITNATDLNIQLAGDIAGASDVTAEIVSSYSGTSLTTGTTSGNALGLTSIKNDLTTLYSAANQTILRNHLGFASPIYHIRPGVEITSTSTADFAVSADLDLTSLRFSGEAGVLTLRAQGNLNVNGTLSDGFVVHGSNTALSRDAKLASSGNAWSYRLIAGADKDAAGLLTTLAPGSTGTLQVAANKLVRTGAGFIDLAASKDIKLLDRAAVFTAGIAAATHPDGFSPITTGTNQNSIYSAFPSGGGDISLNAGQRILMVKSGEATPDLRHVNEWLFRAGGKTRNLQWWPRIASFQQGVAAFGGGDITLTAGTEIKNFTAAIPTNGRVPTINGQRQPDLASIQGGGDLRVRAGGAITGGQFYAESGRLLMQAKTLAGDVGLALGNTQAHVVSQGEMALGNVFNPMWVTAKQVYNSGTTSVTAFSGNMEEYLVRIGTYTDATSLDAVSVAGNVTLSSNETFYGLTDAWTHRLSPGHVKIAALNGGIEGGLAQSPAQSGQLDLLALKSIALDSKSLVQLDLGQNLLPSLRNPMTWDAKTGLALNTAAPSRKHSATAWHEEGEEASHIVSLEGNITAPVGGTLSEFSEAVQILAGGDISNFNITIQHNHSGDASSITAGGSLSYTQGGFKRGIQIDGPGQLQIAAGGNIDLADSPGIVSKGNLQNPYLPEGGANLFVMAGATAPDYAGFLAYLQAHDLSAGNDASPAGLRNRFYDLLRDYGKEAQAGDGDASYAKGRAAVAALFPNLPTGTANLDLFYSTIKTEQGGDIDLLAPRGGINVGIANPSATVSKKPSEQGLFTFNGGAIRAFVKDSFLVNQSRVFTLNGGDILVWADQGSIDAGNGAKTVSATPPPVLVIRNGQIILDATNSVSGSGIGALASRDDTPPSGMYLFAPEGAIDAGDAGLRSTGDITLGARTILNASNIQAGGSVSGAPATAAAPAPAAAPSSPAKSDTGEAAAAAAMGNRESRQGILTVEVLGGEDPEKKKNGDT